MTSLGRAPRLLYLGGFDVPTSRARGIQTVQTAHALARAGWSVRVLAQLGVGPVSVPDALRSYGLEMHPGLEIAPLPVFRLTRLVGLEVHLRLALTNWSYGLACLADLLRRRPPPDLILARDPRLAWIFLRARALHHRPVIYEVHEIFSMRPRDNQSLEPAEVRGVADRTRALERFVFSHADLLLPLTHACADLLTGDRGVSRAKVVVVPDGTVPPGPVPPARSPASREVVYAGQLYPWKGANVLLRAMPYLSDAVLTVYGGDVTSGRRDPDLAACQALARELGVTDRVRFAGFIPHAELRARLAGAGAGVVPLPDRLMSRYFTSPLKLFDYMAAGVPIVAADLPAVREVLVDRDNALLVPPDEPRALAGAIGRLLDDAALAERLRLRAFRQVGAYTWDARAARIIQAAAPLARSAPNAAVRTDVRPIA